MRTRLVFAWTVTYIDAESQTYTEINLNYKDNQIKYMKIEWTGSEP